MTGGSDDARPPTDEPNAVDAAWDALIEETGKDDDDSGPAGPMTALVATSGVPPRARADDEMARLMSSGAPKLPGAKGELESGERDARATARPRPSETAAKPIAKPTPSEPTAKPTPSERTSRPSLQVVTGGATLATITSDEPKRAARPAPQSPASGQARPEVARASRPVEPSLPPAAPAARGLPWAWIGAGAIALGAAAALVPREDSSSDGRPEEESPVVVAPSPEVAPTPTPDLGSSDGVEGTEDTGPTDAGAEAPKPEAKARTGDPREPPPGTPPEIAAVFRRLPVSPYDRPPVGGIGASGIHIDHITMGSETTGTTCSGKSDDFSVSARERAGVCVRVVHPREKEELQVLWEKHDGSTRRSKIVVQPLHAYRTRGYLVLRSEYIGDWTVRILSSDGVELAHHDFTVVP